MECLRLNAPPGANPRPNAVDCQHGALENHTMARTIQKTVQKQTLFNGRDQSWMQFNRRVLEEAADERNPILERIKFLAIFTSNLDEFFMVRMSGAKKLRFSFGCRYVCSRM